MGLDMQLHKRNKAGEPINTETRTFGTNEEYEYEKEFIYWRKANQIHGWFVKNVMDGNDANEGKRYWVSYSKLLEFYDQLVKARLTRDTTIFPPIKGFFFGSDDIDEYYWEEILDTIEQLHDTVKEIRALVEIDELVFYDYSFWYSSNW